MSKKALVVGIDAYSSSPLSGCVNDAKAFAELMKFNGDGTENCDVLQCMDVLTKAALNKLIRNFFRKQSETAIFYFSGHGYVNELGGYIVTPDAKAYDEGIPMNELVQMANTSPCTNKIIILDCCFSAALGEPDLKGGLSIHIGDGLTVLTASKKDEVSWEVGGHGVFTNLLLSALRGGAANLDGQITPGSVYAYIDQALGEHEQRPVFKTNISRFISLRDVSSFIPKEVLWKLHHYFPTPDYRYSLDPSFEDTNTKAKARGYKPVPPYAIRKNVKIFKDLQKLQSAGLVVPVDAKFMFFAAMKSKSCRLTPLGQHYRYLAAKKRAGDSGDEG